MSDPQSINYQPLEAGQHAFGLVLKRYWLRTALLVAVSGITGFVIPPVGLGILALWLMMLYARANAYKNGVWKGFAIANGWQVNAEEDVMTIIPLSLEFGHNQTFSPVISAVLGEATAEMLVYSTIVGEGKSQHGYSFTVARVDLPATLPHILLRAHHDHTEFQQDFADHETLQLEGDFQDYFTLLVEKGQEVDVLEVLTPDVMQTLVNYSQREDIEIMGNSLYFIVDGDARSPEKIRQLVQSVVELSGQITENVRQTAVPRAAPTAVQSVPSAPAAVPVPPPAGQGV